MLAFDRRKFLKASAVAAAGLSGSPHSSAAKASAPNEAPGFSHRRQGKM
ncbi:twin-arginine translocation signal domain-containing protein [Sinorhizobium fredii]